jgi:hypothetical protein
MVVRTVTQIMAELAADTIAENPSLCDWSLNSMNRKTNIPIAIQVQKLETKIEAAAEALDINTATGSDLDSLVTDRGLTRLVGDKASGQIAFVRTSVAVANITIPLGTMVVAEDTDGLGVVRFVTLAEVILLTSTTTIAAEVEAVESGTRSNVRAAAINAIPSGISGIDYVTNPLTFTGGTDEESDDDLRDRYIATATDYGRATVPTMKERLEGLTNTDLEDIVREAKVYNKGGGEVEIVVDTSPTEANIAIVGDGIEACIAAGVCARGCLAASLKKAANAGDLADAAGGKIWVRAKVNVTAQDSFHVHYVTTVPATHEAAFVVPAGTVVGQCIQGVLTTNGTIPSPTDQIVSVPNASLNYAGDFEYDVLIGHGTPPLLFVTPELVPIDVDVTYVATDTPESDLDELIVASIEAFLDDFAIGDEVQFSDLYDAARIQYLGGGVWGNRFYGIDEITALTATDGSTTITTLGEAITIETDGRAEPGTVTAAEPS